MRIQGVDKQPTTDSRKSKNTRNVVEELDNILDESLDNIPGRKLESSEQRPLTAQDQANLTPQSIHDPSQNSKFYD